MSDSGRAPHLPQRRNDVAGTARTLGLALALALALGSVEASSLGLGPALRPQRCQPVRQPLVQLHLLRGVVPCRQLGFLRPRQLLAPAAGAGTRGVALEAR
jgi:hypothetical protein